MKEKIKYVIVGLLIGFILFPTVTLGGTFVSSLIQGKSVPEAIEILTQQIESLIGRVTALETKADKETACRQADELKIAPQETKIAEYSEQGDKSIYASWAPNTTDELLKYLQGYWKNYEATKSRYYLHNPDYDPGLVQKYITILEDRWQEYLIQKVACEK